MEEIIQEQIEEKKIIETVPQSPIHYYYAQIDENNICYGVSDLSGQVEDVNMIPLETYNSSVLGKKYVDGTWEEVPQEEPETNPVEHQPNNAEIKEMLQEIQEQNLILMEALAEMYEQTL